MKRYMIVMNTLEACYRCMKSMLRLSEEECVLVPLSMPDYRERMRGYYKQVMEDDIKLVGIPKEQFVKLYYGPSEQYVEKELKSSSLANKKLKIIKGYLKGNIIIIENWWKKVTGENWMVSAFYNPTAYNYCVNHQSEYSNHNESVNWVLYGKIGGLGYLVNIKELELPEDYKPEEDYIFVEKEIE